MTPAERIERAFELCSAEQREAIDAFISAAELATRAAPSAERAAIIDDSARVIWRILRDALRRARSKEGNRDE